MAGEQETQQDIASVEGQTAPGTPAGAQNTVPTKPAEQTIPYERFKAVNDKLKALESAAEKAAKEQAEAEQKRLAEANEYKTLWEKAQAEAAQQAEARIDAERKALRLQVVAATPGFPTKWADRLRGNTLEEMQADAKELMADLPKPSAPNANGAPGDGSAPRAGQGWWERAGLTKEEAAARLGILPDKMQP